MAITSVKFRRKGQVETWSPTGGRGLVVIVLDEDRQTKVKFTEDQLTGLPDQLVLTHVPVMLMGGRRVEDSVKQKLAEGFNGAFLWEDYPNWVVLVTDPAILSGKRVDGPKPEEGWVNQHFLADGRYVADRARVIHSRTISVLQEGVEVDSTPEAIARLLADGHPFGHPLAEAAKALAKGWGEVAEFAERYGRQQYGYTRDVSVKSFVVDALTRKLVEAGVVRVNQIPDTMTISASELFPAGAWENRNDLGTANVPGVGEVPKKRWRMQFSRDWAMVEMTVAQVLAVKSWPFTDLLISIEGTVVPETTGGSFDNRSPLFVHGDGRWPAIRAEIATYWLQSQRDKNRPDDEEITADPLQEEFHLPDAVLWARGLDGDEHTAYPALVPEIHERWGTVVGWWVRWFDSAEEAEAINASTTKFLQTATLQEKEAQADEEDCSQTMAQEWVNRFNEVSFRISEGKEKEGDYALRDKMEEELDELPGEVLNPESWDNTFWAQFPDGSVVVYTSSGAENTCEAVFVSREAMEEKARASNDPDGAFWL